ncbi:MAG: serine/threonine protein kinase [Planctomycetes bacterium]|nr:serine/threonine protein kinase [Planctomycetota bacterium]
MSDSEAATSGWKQQRALLEEASALEGAAREAYLEHACGANAALRRELDEWLAADSDSELLKPPGAEAVVNALGARVAEPMRVGPWLLEREIGSGGIGRVWLARRVEGGFAQRAAIKLIKRGMDTDDILRRFERERALLAGLEHPGIARLYDGGATEDGRPYLAMEFVDGVALDEHCARGSLSTSAKLELFTLVCDAVQHAHEHLVVHRDLKPSNVLVGPDGRPKLLDFGIAKVVTPDPSSPTTRTVTEHRVLTPLYASPEQLRGEPVTTKSDVYALGLLLHEMLTGRRAFDAERKPDSAPKRVSATEGLRARELDLIVAKATHRDLEQRYASAAALADDVRRYLANEPVLARPDSWTYRAAKFVRRNVLLVSATALVVLALAVGLAVAWSQYRAADEARRAADVRLASVLRVAASLSTKLGARLARIEGILPEREGLLREIVEELEALSREVPEHRAVALELAWSRHALACVLGDPGQPNAGRFDETAALVRRALEDAEPWRTRAPTGGDFAVVAAALRCLQGRVAHYDKDYDRAFEVLSRAFEDARAAESVTSDSELRALLGREVEALKALISLSTDMERHDDRARFIDENLRLLERALKRFPDHEPYRYGLAAALIDRGSLANATGEFQSGCADIERGIAELEALRSAYGSDAIYRRALGVALYRLSDALRNSGRLQDGARAAERALAIHEETLRVEPDDRAAQDQLVNYAYTAGTLAREAGNVAFAVVALGRALEGVDARMARHPEQHELRMTRAAVRTELAAARAAAGVWDGVFELARSGVDDALACEHEPGFETEWNYDMALTSSNVAEVWSAAGHKAGASRAERRAALETAAAELARAREFMRAAEANGELGPAERTLNDTLDRIELAVTRELAVLPVE